MYGSNLYLEVLKRGPIVPLRVNGEELIQPETEVYSVQPYIYSLFGWAVSAVSTSLNIDPRILGQT